MEKAISQISKVGKYINISVSVIIITELIMLITDKFNQLYIDEKSGKIQELMVAATVMLFPITIFLILSVIIYVIIVVTPCIMSLSTGKIIKKVKNNKRIIKAYKSEAIVKIIFHLIFILTLNLDLHYFGIRYMLIITYLIMIILDIIQLVKIREIKSIQKME